ncbi:uncharacterized protein LOC111045901 isoform X2 [Nilaparvata lugens]|nr:uncharacterized protein LOC111045901 isoform X2 [Nilaparvata lugens]
MNWQGTCDPCSTTHPISHNSAFDCRGVNHFGNAGGYHPPSSANGYTPTDPSSSNGYSYVPPFSTYGTFLNDPNRGTYNDPNRASYNDPNRASYDDPNRGSYNDPNSALYNNRAFYNDPNRASYNDPNRASYNDHSRASYNDPLRNFQNGHAHNLYSSGTDSSRHMPIVGYPGYLVYNNVQQSSLGSAQGDLLDPNAEDPQGETFRGSDWDSSDESRGDEAWDLEDPAGWDPEDPQDAGLDPGLNDPQENADDPDDPGFSVTDMISSLAQSVMSLGSGEDSALGTLQSFLANNNPIPALADFAANPTAANLDPGIANLAGNILPQLTDAIPNPNIGELANNILPDLQATNIGQRFTDFANSLSNLGSQLPNINPITGSTLSLGDFAPQLSNALSGGSLPNLALQTPQVLPSVDPVNSAPQVIDAGYPPEFAAWYQGNELPSVNPSLILGSIPNQQTGASQELSTESLPNTNSVSDNGEYYANGDTILQNLLGPDSIPMQQSDIAVQQEPPNSLTNDDSTQITAGFVAPQRNTFSYYDDGDDNIQFADEFTVINNQNFNKQAFIDPLITNISLNNESINTNQEDPIGQVVSPSSNTDSIFRNKQIINQRVPLQILFKSNVSRGEIQVSDNHFRKSNSIRSQNSKSGDKSVCDTIRDSATVFNKTQRAPNINLNPFLVLTPKNLTRSSLSQTLPDTYITAEELEALYEEAVNSEKSRKVLFLPDFELSEEQVQNIVNRISLDISKEEGTDCQELVLIPLNLSNNTAMIPSNDISATAIESDECESVWTLPLYDNNSAVNQELFENTFSPPSSDHGTTTGVSETKPFTPQTCQTLITELVQCDPILSTDTFTYPDITTPDANFQPDMFVSNFSSSGAETVIESSSICDNNQYVKIEKQNNITYFHTLPPDGLSLPNLTSTGTQSVTEISNVCDYNEEPKAEQSCFPQSENRTKHPTEIFIPCFISVGHDENALDKKICEMGQNGFITTFIPHHYMFKVKDPSIQTDSTDTDSRNSIGYLPCPACPEERLEHSNFSSGISSSKGSSTFETMDNVALVDPSNNLQVLCDKLDIEDNKRLVTSQGENNHAVKTNYSHHNSSVSFSMDCEAAKIAVGEQSSSSKVITYPITIDSQDKPILTPCTSGETTLDQNDGNATVKYEVTNGQPVIVDESAENSKWEGTTVLKGDCNNFEPITSGAQQTWFPGTSINKLDLIKNAKDNHHLTVEKDHIMHPKTGITILDPIKKNANINNSDYGSQDKNTFIAGSNNTCTDDIEGYLPPTTQENEIEPSWDSGNIDSNSYCGGDCTKLLVNNIEEPVENQVNSKENQDQAQFLPETKPEVPKCPTSKIFIVKIDNLKPNESCPCNSVNSLLDTVCSDKYTKNGNSKDHNCLCKLLSMRQQKGSLSDKITPKSPDTVDWSLNGVSGNGAPSSIPSENTGYYIIPTNNGFQKPDEIFPQEQIRTNIVWDRVENMKNSTIGKQTCEKSIDKSTAAEGDISSTSPINRNCKCNFGKVNERQRNVSQQNGEYVQKYSSGGATSNSVWQKVETPKLCPPSEKQKIAELPNVEPQIQTLIAAHRIPYKIPAAKVCPSTERQIHKEPLQISSTSENIIPGTVESPTMKQKEEAPEACLSSNGDQVPILEKAIQTFPTAYEIFPPIDKSVCKPPFNEPPTPRPLPRVCPPCYGHIKENAAPTFNSPTEYIPAPPKYSAPIICPPTVEFNKTNEIPVTNIFKPTVQNIPTSSIISVHDTCPPSQDHSQTTVTPKIIQHVQKIPKPPICPTDEKIEEKEIPIFKSTAQNIPVPEVCPLNELPDTILKPTIQNPPTPEELSVTNVCPSNNEQQIDTGTIVPQEIEQSNDWQTNIVRTHKPFEKSPCEKNLNQNMSIADELKASLNESCLCRLKAVLDKHRISNGKPCQNVNGIINKSYEITNFSSPQNDPVLTNCISTDEPSKTNELISQSVSTTRDWNNTFNYNTQVNNENYRGDIKLTTEMDCKTCREKRKELLAKILKEVFINNLDLLCEEKKPCSQG